MEPVHVAALALAQHARKFGSLALALEGVPGWILGQQDCTPLVGEPRRSRHVRANQAGVDHASTTGYLDGAAQRAKRGELSLAPEGGIDLEEGHRMERGPGIEEGLTVLQALAPDPQVPEVLPGTRRNQETRPKGQKETHDVTRIGEISGLLGVGPSYGNECSV